MNGKSDLKELGDFLNSELAITIAGKQYRIPAMTAQNSMIVEEAMTSAKSEDGSIDPMKVVLATDDDAPTFMTRILGSAYQEMLDGGVSAGALQHITRIVTLWTWSGFPAAEEYFKSGGKVLPGQKKTPQDRKPKTVTQTRTGAAPTTRKPASANGTSTQKGTPSKEPVETKS